MRAVAILLLVEMSLTSAASPAPSSAEMVLNSAARAMGRFEPGATMDLRGSITAEGLTGQYHEAVRARDGAFVSHSHYKLFDEGDGYNGTLHWRQDRSGASHSLNGTFSRAEG